MSNQQRAGLAIVLLAVIAMCVLVALGHVAVGDALVPGLSGLAGVVIGVGLRRRWRRA